MANCWPMPFFYDGRQQRSRIIYYHYQQSVSFLLFLSKQYLSTGSDMLLKQPCFQQNFFFCLSIVLSSRSPWIYLKTIHSKFPGFFILQNLYWNCFRPECLQPRALYSDVHSH